MPSNDQVESLKKSVPLWMVAKNRLKGMVRRGQEYDFLCPFHSDTAPSFQVYCTADGTWMGHCKACGKAVNVFQLVQHTDNVSFQEAVNIVGQMTGNHWNENRAMADAVFQPSLQSGQEVKSLPVEAFKSYEEALYKSHSAREWLRTRGIGEETTRLFSLGYVQQPLSQIVPTTHQWSNNGWVLFPEVREGRIVAVKYRSIMGKKTATGESGFAQRKGMLKSPLYNQDAISQLDDLFIVEGELDCLTMAQAGFSSVSLPSAGYNPSADQRASLMDSNTRYLAGDTDEVGINCMAKLYKELGGEIPNSKTYWLQWPKPYKDANQFFLEGCSGNMEKFKSSILQLMQEAKDRQLPGIHDLKTITRTVNFKPTHDNPNRLSFPWPRIDKWVDILPGEVMLMAATETKMGKSTWLMNILVHNVIRKNKKVINFSAELSPERYAQMITANLMGCDRNNLTQKHFQSAADQIPENSFYIGYKPGAKFSAVIKLLEAAKQTYGGDIFVVDPLHFIIRGVDNENVAFASAMKDLVDFSIQWNVIMIVVGQVRKSKDGGRGKSAQGQDIRGTAAFGEDAATTWILHRDRINKTATDGEENEAIFSPITQVKLEYSRNSDPTSTRLLFNGPLATFGEYNNQISQEQSNYQQMEME